MYLKCGANLHEGAFLAVYIIRIFVVFIVIILIEAQIFQGGLVMGFRCSHNCNCCCNYEASHYSKRQETVNGELKKKGETNVELTRDVAKSRSYYTSE